MRVNDLRIGNHVKQGKVISFHESGVHVGLGKCFSFEELEPILLTEKILLKCGFENYTGDFLELTITEDLSVIWVGYLGIVIDGSTVFFPDKDKVHELQNLYKELKGEELTVKL